MGVIPTGTVTFAFTDIEGSTVRWDHDRPGMEDAVRRHDALLTAAIVDGGGYVFKTIGDAFCATFARPENALAAMLEAQRAIATEDFSAVGGMRVRMALHTGTADERGGDYFGPTVNRVARLLATAHGGQVILSGAVAELVHGSLPPQSSLRDLGEHQLKDIARPEHVYQLVTPDLPADFPPLNSLGRFPNNLPGTLTSLLGRENEIEEISALLSGHRLVTLVGSGGVGKTRTALQIAANLVEAYRDGVWVIELAPLSRGDYIASAVAHTLGLAPAASGDPVDALVNVLKPKRALLFFDNCEHLIEGTRKISVAILRSCPGVSIIASSREGLKIAGEAIYRIPSLNASTAVALFVERAKAIDHRFDLSNENAESIAHICRRLDGIPLAIELAAARIKVLTPQQMCTRLDERFRLLTGGSHDVLPHQQTLRALFDWSYDLLDERERAFFRHLSIFRGGFSIEGAKAVASTGESEVLDVLGSLVDKSLVLAENTGDMVRYRLLESARAYAEEKMQTAGESDVCAARHLAYHRDAFLAAEEQYQHNGDLSAFSACFAAELDNVRAALDYAVNGSGVTLGAALLAATRGPWQDLGLDGEALARIEAFLAVLPESEARLNAGLWNAVSRIAHNSGQSARALEAATRAIGYARTADDPLRLSYALMMYADGASVLGRFADAEAAHAEATAIANLPKVQRWSLLAQRATLSSLSGDLLTAKRAFEQLLADHRSAGNAPGERSTALNLAEVEHMRGYTNQAVAILQAVIPSARAHTDRSGLTLLLANLSGYLLAIDDVESGSIAAREAIQNHASSEPESWRVTVAIEHLALGVALTGEHSRAALLKGYADAAFRKDGFQRQYTEQTTNDRLSEHLHKTLSPEELERFAGEGSGLTAEAAIALAMKAQ